MPHAVREMEEEAERPADEQRLEPARADDAARPAANDSGPLARAISQTASATAPSDSNRPVIRCRLDSHIVISQR